MFVSPKPEDIQMTSSCLLLRLVVSAARSCGDVERKEAFAEVWKEVIWNGAYSSFKMIWYKNLNIEMPKTKCSAIFA